MIKGWRNDPRWVEFYRRRDEERYQRYSRNILLGLQISHEERLQRALASKPKLTSVWSS